MQKTKLGISVGMLGAAIYFVGMFGGYVPAGLLVGYVLLCEQNEWLRRNAVKAMALMVLFSLASAIVYLIPDAIAVISDLASIFGGSFGILFLSKLVTALADILDLIRKLLFISLGLKALNQGSIAIGFVDGLLNQYM